MVEAKLDAARADLVQRDGVLVAFSGGVDSSVVAVLADDALGDDAVACTAKSETLPAAELDEARRVAEEIGIEHDVVEFSELDRALDPAFARAASDHVGALGFEHVTLDLAGYRTGSVSPDETPAELDSESSER